MIKTSIKWIIRLVLLFLTIVAALILLLMQPTFESRKSVSDGYAKPEKLKQIVKFLSDDLAKHPNPIARLELTRQYIESQFSRFGLNSRLQTFEVDGQTYSNVIVDIPLSDTYFVVAHFHMVMAVSPVLAVFGAVYHWYPKITGRMLNETLGKFHFWVTFVGLYCIYYPMHYLGILGVPRRYYATGVTDFIPESAQVLNAGISIAAIIVASTQLVFLYNLAVSTTRGKPAGDNPWGATTLEWQTATTPPSHGNFGKELPLVYRWAYDYSVPGAKEDFIPQNVPASGDTGDAR